MPPTTTSHTMHIVDGTRSVYPRGRRPMAVWLVFLLPLLTALLIFADEHLGSRAIMLSFTVFTATAAVCLVIWATSMHERVVHVTDSGTLRFLPPRRLSAALWSVTMVGILPGMTTLGAQLSGLPIADIRGIIWGPYIVTLLSLFELGRMILARRVPAGLTLDAEGIRGIRGSKRIDLRWDEVGSIQLVGSYGPKFTVSIAGRAPVTIDAHYLGSDPACVVAILNYFRDRPDHRPALADSASAVNTVERDLHID